MKPLAARLALALGAFVATLLVLELGVRLAAPAPLAPQRDVRRGAFTQPGQHPVQTPEFSATVHVNEAGFVDRAWGPRRPTVPRVVVLGDSFVQAAQVELEEGFGRQLDEALDRATQGDVEVLSLGVPGAGTATALHLLDGWALDLQPDLVVLGFLVSNDVFNNHPDLDTKPDKPFYRLTGGRLVPVDGQDAARGWLARSTLWRSSHLVRALGRRVLAGAEARDRVQRGGGLPLDLRVHDPARPDPWPEAWRVTGALVGALAERCAAAGVPFGVLLFPDRIQATDAGLADARARWPELVDWDVQAATRAAEAQVRPHAPVADLTPTLRAASAGGAPLYYPQDGHWTPRGHAVAARAAAPVVAGWIPDPLR